jgi:hypothetical protein
MEKNGETRETRERDSLSICSIMYAFELVERSEELATRQRLRGVVFEV